MPMTIVRPERNNASLDFDECGIGASLLASIDAWSLTRFAGYEIYL
jgi:hypothetical protein